MEQLNLTLAIPEIALAIFALCFLLVDSLTKGRFISTLHSLVILFCVGLGAYCLSCSLDAVSGQAFNGMYINDGMGLALKGFAAFAIALTLLLGRSYAQDRAMFKGELHALVMFSLLGQFVMISANNLLLVYLGVELLSLSLYAAVAMQRENTKATEAAMKYFVLGALASGFLLYGMSMIYGATGSLNHADIVFASAGAGSKAIIFTFGLVFLVAGLAFKLGVVPFHMWVPDVYEGSPSIITLLISGAPKLAAFAMVMRLLVDGLYPKAFDWQNMLLLLALASLAIGNLVAVAQTNLKRMLAYSTIAQMGFVLLGVVSSAVVEGGTVKLLPEALSASMFYCITYVLTTTGTFGVMMALSRKGLDVEHISDLKGLNQRAPWLALVMLVLMFSLAGLPPLVGFDAKLAVLKSVLETDRVWLAVYAVLFSLIGAFYYIRIVKTMYFDAPTDISVPEIPAGTRLVLSMNGVLVFVLGLLPASLLGYCLQLVLKSVSS